MSAEHRKLLFNRYAQNLEDLKRLGMFHIELNDFFLCPQCLRVFLRSELDDEELTIEHVPPQSVGHAQLTLTCKRCNNDAGSILESKLKRKLIIDDFQAGIVGTKLEVRISPGEGIWLHGTAYRDQPNRIVVEGFLHPEHTHPVKRQRATELLSAENATIEMQHSQPGWRRVEVALLRIAYLYAFSVLGYGLILHPRFQAVRGQLNKPKEHILPARWRIPIKPPFPPGPISLNIVAQPEHLRAFVVFFELTSPERFKEPFAVVLPNPYVSGEDIYSRFEEAMRTGGLQQVMLGTISPPSI
jgi:hypothetical protein